MTKKYIDMASEEFSFLENMGFQKRVCNAYELRYKALREFVIIEWDPRSGELEAFVGNEGSDQPAYSLTDIIRMESMQKVMPYQVSEETMLAPFLKKMADNLRIYGKAALAGDRMFLYRLNNFRKKQAADLLQDMNLQRIRQEVERAWQLNDFKRVSILLESMKKNLTPSEKKRLSYARKRLN